MTSSTIDLEPVIWARFLEAQAAREIPAEVARFLLTLGFPATDRERIDYLASRSQDGELTPSEDAEYGGYINIGNLLTVLKSRARTVLGRAASEVQTSQVREIMEPQPSSNRQIRS